MNLDELDFDIPARCTATAPASPRDSAKLMLVNRSDATAAHHIVRDLPTLLRAGDVLVFNSTRVIPARFEGIRADTGGNAQGLYLRDADHNADSGDGLTWHVMLRMKRPRVGARITLHAPAGTDAPAAELELLHPVQDVEPGTWAVRVHSDEPHAVLERFGRPPLPPYILAARRDRDEATPDELDRAAYQTTYARTPGSVAAPTAGLHFTPELLAALDDAGVERVEVTLHVGAGTFRPIESDRVEDHRMHREWCAMSAEAIRAVQSARAEGRRVIAVGTTSARTLESFARATADGSPPPEAIDTDLMIKPGDDWLWADGLLTNFHQPRTTLLLLVGSLLGGADGAGVRCLRDLYEQAVAHDYRFFSYGDAMLLLPD